MWHTVRFIKGEIAMLAKKAAYLAYMDKNGIRYTDISERAVKVAYRADNINSISVYVSFDEKSEGRTVQFASWGWASVPENKYAQGLVVCNMLNEKFRWVKFYIDKDKDVCVEADAIVDDETVGQECREMVSRLVAIADEAYPAIMRAIYG